MARTGEWRGVFRSWWGGTEGKRPVGRSGINGIVVLKWISKTRNWGGGEAWTGLIWLGMVAGGGLL